MAVTEERSEVVESNFEWFQILGRLGVVAAGYPLDYVKVLIQIGHEPIAPVPCRTMFGRPALALPGAFTYMKYIKKVNGFWGLYTGLTPRLTSNFLNLSTYLIVEEKLPNIIDESLLGKPESELTDEQKLIVHANELVKSSAARIIAIIVSHPFHVITIRTIAQFVGKEEKYGGIFGSLGEIYNTEGILGFYRGVIPRIIGELLTAWAATTASVLINTYLIEEESLKGYVKASMNYLASAFFYPFQVVTHVMIVNNCGLKAGLPGNMPIYASWLDCWSHLSAIGQLKRGSSLLWRYYNGPFMPGGFEPSNRRVYAQAFPYSLHLH
ncbi:Mitochondrial carrier 2 [Araneus ventricosus]|uniref:Mitochondrial carrier 2 n=1 Tax=Araneus ventricosus TaxID=182803 RepID=A0A4Y2ELZ9_ARAVE|nr:Mitochondrial carrier 2 [Araneus ventricosus]